MSQSINILSPTKIAVYITCPFMYRLKYIEHKKVPTSINMVFGKEIHYMLEQFYKKNYKSADSFANTFKYRWAKVIAGDFLKGKEKEALQTQKFPYILKNGGKIEYKIGNHIKIAGDEPIKIFFSYRALGVKILTDFYNKHKNEQYQPIELEKRFRMDFRGYRLRGVIDRIDNQNGSHYIADYKTDKHAPQDSFSIDRHPQFTIYSWAFRQLYGKKEKGILYYHLRSMKTFLTQRSEKDYDYLEQLCETVSEGILKEQFVQKYGYQCGFCDYKDACGIETGGYGEAIQFMGFEIEE